MRLTLTSGETTIDLRTDPGEGVSLRAAEHSALRLFRALPKAATSSSEEQPFGFSLSADTERSPEPDHSEEDDE